MRNCLTTVLLLLAAVTVNDNEVWEWVNDNSHHKSMVHIEVAVPQVVEMFGSKQIIESKGFGSGVVIAVDKSRPINGGYVGLIATARHVVIDCAKNNKIKIEFDGLQVSGGCKVIAWSNERDDVALVECVVPEGIEAMPIEDTPLRYQQEFEFAGYGNRTRRERIRHFKGEAARPTDSRKLYADESFVPGDSGGAAFVDGVVVGICNGGCIWWKESGDPQNMTWPARLSQSTTLIELISQTEWKGKVEIR